MKTIVLFVVVALMVFSVGAAYAMGGGGGHGDGRLDYANKSGTNDGAFPGQQGIGYDNSNAGGNGNHYGWDKDRDNGNGNDPAQKIPEPLTLLLLGSGLVSLVVVRKKMR